MTMWIIFGYALPAVVFFVLACLDEILCTDELTIGAVIAMLVVAVIPFVNIGSLISISNDLIKKYDLINWDFVIYRRKK